MKLLSFVDLYFGSELYCHMQKYERRRAEDEHLLNKSSLFDGNSWGTVDLAPCTFDFMHVQGLLKWRVCESL